MGWEDPLEMEMVAHSSILAWRIPWTEEPGGLQSVGLQESDSTEVTNHVSTVRSTNAQGTASESFTLGV